LSDRPYSDAEIRAFSRMSWWEYQNLEPAKIGRQRTMQAPQQRTRSKPARDFIAEPLSGPIDYLSMPVDALRRRI
jgi:hypothetical protein